MIDHISGTYFFYLRTGRANNFKTRVRLGPFRARVSLTSLQDVERLDEDRPPVASRTHVSNTIPGGGTASDQAIYLPFGERRTRTIKRRKNIRTQTVRRTRTASVLRVRHALISIKNKARFSFRTSEVSTYRHAGLHTLQRFARRSWRRGLLRLSNDRRSCTLYAKHAAALNIRIVVTENHMRGRLPMPRSLHVDRNQAHRGKSWQGQRGFCCGAVGVDWAQSYIAPTRTNHAVTTIGIATPSAPPRLPGCDLDSMFIPCCQEQQLINSRPRRDAARRGRPGCTQHHTTTRISLSRYLCIKYEGGGDLLCLGVLTTL